MANPLLTHWTIVKRLLWYLKGTISYDLHLQPTANDKFISTTAIVMLSRH